MSNLSLRARLVLVVAVVALGAIVAVDVATWRSLRSSSYDRLDDQVRQALDEVPPPQGGGLPGGSGPPQRPLPANTWVGVYTERGGGDRGRARAREYERIAERVAQVGVASRDVPPNFDPRPEGRPRFRGSGGRPRELVDPEAPVTARQRPQLDGRELERLTGAPRTLPAERGERSFRVAARRLGRDGLIVAALPTDEVESTLERLVRIELVVSMLAGLGVLLLALFTVRAGLRPLEQIAVAASRIAGPGGVEGERVPAGGAPGTEVGQLSMSINAMLDRIDDSFHAQREVEQQLRRFVADASHELRTPLTSIQGYAELARTRAAEMTPDELQSALRNVEEEAQHLALLVEDLLLLSHLDEGRLPATPIPTDVASIAGRAVDAARAVEPARSIELEMEGATGGDGIVATVDPVRVRQLLDNLLANVRVHAGPQAQAVVRVRALAAGAVELQVRDDGPGLSGDDSARATERFWRADDARTRATGGSGLGLAIVQAIAASHSGTVELSSAPGGRGLAVTVTLPAPS